MQIVANCGQCKQTDTCRVKTQMSCSRKGLRKQCKNVLIGYECVPSMGSIKVKLINLKNVYHTLESVTFGDLNKNCN